MSFIGFIEGYCVKNCGGEKDPSKCEECAYTNYGRDCRNQSIDIRKKKTKENKYEDDK